jgi:hypothetical protein
VTEPVEERLTLALDGRPVAGDDADLGPLLDVAGHLRETLVRVPAPEPWRRELRDWLLQPQRRPWWRRLMDPVERRPAVGAAIGAGAVAAVAVGIVLARHRRVASASR